MRKGGLKSRGGETVRQGNFGAQKEIKKSSVHPAGGLGRGKCMKGKGTSGFGGRGLALWQRREGKPKALKLGGHGGRVEKGGGGRLKHTAQKKEGDAG